MKDKIEMGALERVCDARHQISEQFNHEPEQLIKYYINLQQNYKNRLMGLDKPESKQAA